MTLRDKPTDRDLRDYYLRETNKLLRAFHAGATTDATIGDWVKDIYLGGRGMPNKLNSSPGATAQLAIYRAAYYPLYLMAIGRGVTDDIVYETIKAAKAAASKIPL